MCREHSRFDLKRFFDCYENRGETKIQREVEKKKVVENLDEGVRRFSLGNGKVGGVESRRLSFDSVRKGWDMGSRLENGGRGITKDNFLRLESVFPHDLSNLSNMASPPKRKNGIISPKHVAKPTVGISKSSKNAIFPSDYNNLTICPRSWSDSNIFWDALPSAICDLGKDTKSFRNVAFASAVQALEEASLYNGVLWCLRTMRGITEKISWPIS